MCSVHGLLLSIKNCHVTEILHIILTYRIGATCLDALIMSQMEERNHGSFVECPVCSREFSAAAIENHVDKCLFLNETAESYKPKRSLTKEIDTASSVIAKKPRTAENSASPVRQQSTSAGVEIEETLEPNCSATSKSDNQNCTVPLAEKMRPTDIMSYIGQSHVIGPQSMLYQLLTKTEIPNLLLWGPPGCGKTSLANVIANICKSCPGRKYRFVKLSAAMSGVNDVKEAITIASNELKFRCRTVMFMDEIHRFNKVQQDIFLPHIESGTIILIGATTENPSFSLNSALLSRCRVVVLEKLTIENLIVILEKAVKSSEGSIIDAVKKENISDFNKLNHQHKFLIDKETIKWLAETSDGDARIALGGLELAIKSKVSNQNESNGHFNLISLDDIQESLKKTHMLYDRKGDQHYDLISALHKSVRASDENASLYWLTRMLAGGEDPVYIARRLVRMASEDVGLADPKALGLAVHTMHACKMLGMPECDVILAQCTTYLAKAPKSRLMEDALRAAQHLVSNYKGAQPGVPLHLRNAPTKLMKNLGYAKGYNMLHKNKSQLNYLPEEINSVDFFNEN